MNNYCKYLFFLSFLFVVFSCTDSINVRPTDYSMIDTILINTEDCTYDVRDSIFKKVSYIKLETTENNLIGRINQLFFVDSTIVVVDKTIAKAVYLFDIQGNFKTKVSGLGRGPHEYLSLIHVFIDRDSHTIGINDMIKSEINYFDLDGRYVRTFNYDFPFNEVESLGGGLLVCNIHQGRFEEYPSLNDYSFVILDEDNKPEYVFGDDNSTPEMNVSRNRNLYPSGNHVFCSVNFTNIIYELTDSGAIARYQLKAVPEDLKDVSFKSGDEAIEYFHLHVDFPGFYVELKDYTILAIDVPENGRQFFVYNHNNCETYRIPSDSSNPLMSFFSTPFFVGNDNSVVVSANSAALIDLKNELNSFGLQDNRLEELSNNLEMESNPVLILYEL